MKTKNKRFTTKIKKAVLISLAVFLGTYNAIFTIADASAASLFAANRNDIYNQLLAASETHFALYFMRKCINNGKLGGNDNKVSASEAASGDIFSEFGRVANYSTTLWFEHDATGETGTKLDGNLRCNESTSYSYRAVQALFAKVGISNTDILCGKSGNGLLLQADGHQCKKLDATMKWNKDGWESHLKSVYEQYKAAAGNPYLFDWSEINNFNNVDGYFSYIADFEERCNKSEYLTVGSTGDFPVVTFNKQDKKLVAKRQYVSFKVAMSDKKMKWDTAAFYLDGEGRANNCAELLERTEELRLKSNEVETREGGYQGILIATLKKSCMEAEVDGKNAWEEAERQLNDIISNPPADAKENLVEDAQKMLDDLHKAQADGYIKQVGDIDGGDDEMTIECIEPEAFTINVDDYTNPMEEVREEISPGASEEGASCFDGTGVVGWIVCPIIEFLGDFIQGVYEAFIVPFLQLDVELFKSDSPIYAVWDNLRNVANLGFVIFFIVVIFSQLTGVGIDNYGIKKILPKLIMGAILINLSFIICQLAVDLSNILGYSIENILDSWMPTAGQLNITRTHGAGTVIGSIALDGALLICIVKFLVLPAVLAIGPEIWVAVLLVVITVAIAILFCFILLTIRKSFAVLLVIVSPLAFMCYILPNTKSLFDKWFKTFKSVLLAFPICSAMIYGGQFVGRVLVQAAANNGGHAHFSVALSGAVITIVPIFLIPTVLRHSMGAIGAMMGRLQGGLTRAARFHAGNSGWAQEKKMQGIQYRNARRAGFKASLRDGSVLKDPMVDKNGNVMKDENGNVMYKFRTRSAFYNKDGSINQSKLARFRRALGGNTNQSIAAATGRMMKDIEMQPMSSDFMQSANDIQRSYEDRQFEKTVSDFMQSSDYSNITRKGTSFMQDMLRNNGYFPQFDGRGNVVEGVRKNITSSQALAMQTAVARAMASGDGKSKKALASMIENGEIGNETLQKISADTSIRNAINDKGRPLTSRYLEGVAGGQISASTSYQDWSQDPEVIRSLAYDTDKAEDLASYDSNTFEKVINAKDESGNYIISDDTIQRTVDNKDLTKKLKDAHFTAAAARGITPSGKSTTTTTSDAGAVADTEPSPSGDAPEVIEAARAQRRAIVEKDIRASYAKQPDESHDHYENRIKYMTEMTLRAEDAGPRDGMSHSDYNKKANIVNFKVWHKDKGGKPEGE